MCGASKEEAMGDCKMISSQLHILCMVEFFLEQVNEANQTLSIYYMLNFFEVKHKSYLKENVTRVKNYIQYSYHGLQNWIL
jgi:hypothetical protein